MAAGFITNDAAVTAIGTSFAAGKVIELGQAPTGDSKSRQAPQSSFWDHLELDLVVSGATSVSALICWDSDGDVIATGPTAAKSITARITTAGQSFVSFSINGWFTAPSGQTAPGKAYLFLLTDAGTVDVPAGGARLHWANPNLQG